MKHSLKYRWIQDNCPNLYPVTSISTRKNKRQEKIDQLGKNSYENLFTFFIQTSLLFHLKKNKGTLSKKHKDLVTYWYLMILGEKSSSKRSCKQKAGTGQKRQISKVKFYKTKLQISSGINGPTTHLVCFQRIFCYKLHFTPESRRLPHIQTSL
jgi:hypothetical protein